MGDVPRDKRTLLRAPPPKGKSSRMVNAYLSADDYEKLWNLAHDKNQSIAETIRELVRDA